MPLPACDPVYWDPEGTHSYCTLCHEPMQYRVGRSVDGRGPDCYYVVHHPECPWTLLAADTEMPQPNTQVTFGVW